MLLQKYISHTISGVLEIEGYLFAGQVSFENLVVTIYLNGLSYPVASVTSPRLESGIYLVDNALHSWVERGLFRYTIFDIGLLAILNLYRSEMKRDIPGPKRTWRFLNFHSIYKKHLKGEVFILTKDKRQGV